MFSILYKSFLTDDSNLYEKICYNVVSTLQSNRRNGRKNGSMTICYYLLTINKTFAIPFTLQKVVSETLINITIHYTNCTNEITCNTGCAKLNQRTILKYLGIINDHKIKLERSHKPSRRSNTKA